MNYSQAVEYLESFPDMERGTHGYRGASMTVDAMRSLLKRLDNPQLGRHTIHVTGSKGKGSTCAMIAAILAHAGLSTALYTSPHLHSYRERIAFDLEPVPEEAFAKGVAEIRSAIDEEQKLGTVSTFGVLTALFFHLAKTHAPPVEWQIVEVGLGGRYDATNVFDTKDMVAITAISLEHVEILGSSPSEIATNKGAIITPGCTAVLAPQKDPAVRSVIGRQCHQVGATLVDVGARGVKIKQLSHDLTGQRFSIEGQLGTMELKVPLIGTHQMANAATAAIVAKSMIKNDVKITDDDIKDGLLETKIHGRMEILAGTRAGQGNEGPVIIADGAHNHESAAALADTLKSLFNGRKCVFVIGVNKDKNINAIWRELHPLCRTVITTKSRSLRAMDPKSIAEAVTFQATQDHAECTDSVAQAMELALRSTQGDDLICVTGSLYVVAEAREYLASLA